MVFQYKVRNPDGTMGEMKKFGDEDTAEEKAARLEQKPTSIEQYEGDVNVYSEPRATFSRAGKGDYGAFHVNCKGIRRRRTKCLMNIVVF